eukprot:6519500-Prymnesium_polylepis.2
MAPKKATPAVSLKSGDRVSVETRVWGEGWAMTTHGDKDWKTGRTYGEVLRKDSGGKWVCDFGDGEHVAWARSALRFEKRSDASAAPAAAGKAPAPAAGKAPAAGEAPAPAPAADSSDEENLDSEPDEMPEDDDGAVQTADGWVRNNAVRMGQRAKDSILFTSEPNLKLPHDSTLYQYALHFLPLGQGGTSQAGKVDEIEALAARMTDEGIKKFKAGQRKYSDWLVTREGVQVDWHVDVHARVPDRG